MQCLSLSFYFLFLGMPRYVVARRRRRSRVARRVRRYSMRARRIPRIPCRTAWPSTMRVKLVYSINLPINTSNKAYFYSMNDLSSPNSVTGGHRPYGFEQWTAVYSQYLVQASSIDFRFSVATTAEAHVFTLAPSIDADQGAAPTATELKERPNAVSTLVGTGLVGRLRIGGPLSKWVGPIDPSLHGALVTANPVEEFQWLLASEPIVGSTYNANASGLVTYWVTFSRPNNVAQSA